MADRSRDQSGYINLGIRNTRSGTGLALPTSCQTTHDRQPFFGHPNVCLQGPQILYTQMRHSSTVGPAILANVEVLDITAAYYSYILRTPYVFLRQGFLCQTHARSYASLVCGVGLHLSLCWIRLSRFHASG